jgi:phosphatidyl-myo-inositol dimannoside synthase
MTRILLVTNDFPPRPGGIQSYLEQFVERLSGIDGEEVTVYAPQWKGADDYDRAAGFPIVRHPGTLMVPESGVERRMRALIAERGVETVWFGAAAPLALLARRARQAGAARIVASTHGHEVGWSMLPGARSALRRIGESTDVVTYVSRYTRGRIAAAFGPSACLEHLPPGIDTNRFRPDPAARDRLRAELGLGGCPTVVCVSRLVPRKGQDMLIDAWPRIRRRFDGAALVIVGGGPYRRALERRAAARGVAGQVVFTGSVPTVDLPAYFALADVFAMPCRTRGAGLDVEGLGIVFLEASSAGAPVVVGDSGGAPETVLDGRTGLVVDGRCPDRIAEAVGGLLSDPRQARRLGQAGRDWVRDQWNWDTHTVRLAELLRVARFPPSG